MDDDTYRSEVAERVDTLLAEATKEKELTVADLLLLAQIAYIRLRVVLTLKNIYPYLTAVFHQAEDMLQVGKGVVTEEGEYINIALAEELEVLGKEGFDIPDPEEWLE